MKREEFEKKLVEIKKEHDEKIKKLKIEYAMANNPFHVGAIIRDHKGIIRIEEIVVRTGKDAPDCYYSGPRLKKNLKPYKTGEHSYIFHCNVIEEIKC